MFQVKALYDFVGEPNTDEMSISCGEVLTVTRTDVGIGWWEGKNSVGTVGLFPESYVERVQSGNVLAQTSSTTSVPQSAHHSNDDWDDDWDDDTYSEIPSAPPSQYQAEQIYSNEGIENYNYMHHANDTQNTIDNKGSVSKKSLNRFSAFVKSGFESYILGELKTIISNDQKIQIMKVNESTFAWPELHNTYTVLVTSPKKETKLKGLKSFIAYQLTPSFNNIQVSRRYKQFDWLHERLCEKFSLIAIPPLPDKQISGRYEELFIEHRRAQLQEFVDYICRHPVLSRCDVWQHFLTCTDEKLWKQGKRVAEKDALIGANFCLCIDAPDKTLLPSVSESIENEYIKYINTLDNSFKLILNLTADQSKKYKMFYAKENVRIGEMFISLGLSTEQNKATPCHLSNVMRQLGTVYTDIGKLYEKQPTLDWDNLGDKFYICKGITSSFQGIFTICKGTQNKKKECEKSLSGTALNDLKKRSDVLTYSILAELNHFKNERDNDMKISLRTFINQQITFYKNIVEKFEEALQAFDG